MKKLKITLIALAGCLIVLGLYLANKGEDKEYTKTEFIMDTTCSVTFYGEDAEKAAEAVFDEVLQIDNLMNMYKEDSDVSRINRAGANEEIKVSPDTYKVIETALEVSRKSGGAFDITIAPVTALWNFGGENPTVPSEAEIKTALLSVGYENIVLKGNNTVVKLKGETKIDLGGAAKGYAGDCALKVAKKYNLTGGIIDLGGNIICFGENPKSENGKWTVGIQTPFKATGSYEKTVEIGEGAVVTSGTYQRYFEANGKKYHHLIDPKTGQPKNQKYNSATVVTESSLEADCLSTAAFIMGKEEAEKLIKSYSGEIYYE